MKTKKRVKFDGYELVPETSGKICAGVYISNDEQSLIVSFAWGGSLRYGAIKARKD